MLNAKVICINNTLEDGTGTFGLSQQYTVKNGTLIGKSIFDSTKKVEYPIHAHSVEDINQYFRDLVLDTKFQLA